MTAGRERSRKTCPHSGTIARPNSGMPLVEACAAASRRLIDMVLPPLCVSCGEIVGTPGALWPPCWPEYTFIAEPHCACCGTPFAADLGADALCVSCLA